LKQISKVLIELQPHLARVSDTPVLDSQVLIAHILGKSRTWVLAHPQARLSPEQYQNLDALAKRVANGVPLPYVLGSWEFYGLDFKVTPDVLIPRPETELLVEQAINWLHANPQRRWAADIGTGSGCLAVSLAVNVTNLQIIAGDISPEALEVARYNAKKHGVATQLDIIQSDLLHDLQPPSQERFDIICANLPYIPSGMLQKLDVSLREPHQALDGGEDGLDFFRRLLKQAPSKLAPGGLLLLEIEASLGASVSDLAKKAFPQSINQLLTDLAGLDRLVMVELRS
jgi:release factor glutamine methyltransferase